MRGRGRPTRRRSGWGFTLVEMLVVVAVIALVAGIALPRLVGNERRGAIAAAESAAELLTMLAHRESMGDGNLALTYDPGSRSIMLLRLTGPEGARPDEMSWTLDPFVRPVRLPAGMAVTGLRLDGRPMRPESWVVPIGAGGARPLIELTLTSPDLETTLVLPPTSTAVVMTGLDEDTTYLRAVDLDAQGREREPW